MMSREKGRISAFFASGWLKLLGGALVGVAVLVGLSVTKQPPKRLPPSEQGKAVRTVTVHSQDVVPRAVGYGVVKAKQDWQMAAQVSGRVVNMSPLMKVGALIPEGTVILQIDPEDYQLEASRKTAGVENAKAQLNQLNAQEESARATLEIEKKAEELARRDLERAKRLFAAGSLSQSDLDKTEKELIAEEKSIQNLKNTLAEIPAQRALLKAQIKDSQVGLRGARLEIDRTRIVAPYDLRIRALNVQDQEIVVANQVLAEADGIDAIEVNAQFTVGAIRPIISLQPEQQPLSFSEMANRNLPEVTGITALVRLKNEGAVTERVAILDSITTVDSTTRTMGIVVVVKNPYRPPSDGQGQGPIIPGMYAEVELSGRVRKGCIAVPRSAVHNDKVYVVNAKSRLEYRELGIDFTQAEYACVNSGLNGGEKVVLSNLSPAIEGMLLEPKPDNDTEALLKSISVKESATP